MSERRYYVVDSQGEQVHGPYLNRENAVRDAGKEQAETHEEHEVEHIQNV